MEILIENSAVKSNQLEKHKKIVTVSAENFFFFSQAIYYEMSAVIVPYFKERLASRLKYQN